MIPIEQTRPTPFIARSHARPQLVVLQPTPFCNIQCRYCYLPDRSNRARMSLDVLHRIFSQCFESKVVESPFTFLWHAGEPLVLPVGFYRDAFTLALATNEQFNKTFDHYIQTNGMLLNDDWIDLIREFEVGIGVSLDGPAFLHDSMRRTRSGKGTHEKVMAGIRLLQNADIPFHVIAVLTSRSLDYPEEMFDFFINNGIREVGFNIDEVEGPHRVSSLETTGALERYADFMLTFLNLAERDPGRISVREFESILKTMVNGTLGEFIDSTNQPLGVINFDYAGNFSTFSPELLGATSERFEDFRMGNILENNIDEIQLNSNFLSVAREIEIGVAACKESCEYWGFCGGGPPANKFFEHGRFTGTETLFCRVHKKTLVDVVLGYAELRMASAM